jgi:hypothetical protein
MMFDMYYRRFVVFLLFAFMRERELNHIGGTIVDLITRRRNDRSSEEIFNMNSLHAWDVTEPSQRHLHCPLIINAHDRVLMIDRL